MALPYSEATSGQGREKEIRDLLRKVGATAVGFMQDDDKGLIIAQFRLKGREITVPVPMAGYTTAWLEENPHTGRHRSTLAQHRQKAADQAERAAWAVLADWIKAQSAMIVCGFMDQDEAFLPHIHLPDGRRVHQAVKSADGPIALPPPATE